jgi:Co/Zn/Cd efflux system component
MVNQERKRNHRNEAMMLDLLHIVIGILVVICAVLAFLEPEKNQFLFPVIFWLAGLLNGASGWYRLKNSGRDKKRKVNGVILCMLAVILVLVGVASAISIRR